jgi:hypothetical protein
MRYILSLLFALALALPARAEVTAITTATSLAASFNSSAYTAKNFRAIDIQVVVSTCASCDGIFKLQLTNVVTPASTDWSDIDGTSQRLTADGTAYWHIDNPAFYKLRLVYTRTAGTGLVSGNISAKEVTK